MGVTLDEEAPRLAEINRAIQDFRNEFRDAMKGMVRRDVYDAHQQTIQLQINNMDTRIATVEKERDEDLKERKDERRSTRNLVIGVAIPGAISLAIAITTWLMR